VGGVDKVWLLGCAAWAHLARLDVKNIAALQACPHGLCGIPLQLCDRGEEPVVPH
jgi:hypothetical protein